MKQKNLSKLELYILRDYSIKLWSRFERIIQLYRVYLYWQILSVVCPAPEIPRDITFTCQS